MHPRTVIIALWTGWAVSWILAAAWSNRTERRVGLKDEMGYRLSMGCGAAIMAAPVFGFDAPLSLWRVGFAGVWVCAALIAVGLALTWWARLHLGRLWSARVTRKVDHTVVDSGPYGLVRHPIYSGLLLSMLATAVAEASVMGVVGFVTLLLGIWLKARLEERWLTAELGVDAYGAYRRRVPMLLPFIPPSR